MNVAQWYAVAAVAAATGSFALATWGSIAEQDAPGWRSNSAIGAAGVCVLLLGMALVEAA